MGKGLVVGKVPVCSNASPNLRPTQRTVIACYKDPQGTDILLPPQLLDTTQHNSSQLVPCTGDTIGDWKVAVIIFIICAFYLRVPFSVLYGVPYGTRPIRTIL